MTARQVRRLLAMAAVALGVISLVVSATNAPHTSGDRGAGHVLRAIGTTRYVLPFAAMALIWIGHGLQRAKRNAWRVAIVATIAAGVTGATRGQLLLGTIPSVVMLVMLIHWRGSFTARGDPSRPRDAARVLLIGVGVVFAYGTLGLYFLDSEFSETTTLAQSMRETARLLVLLPASSIGPDSVHGQWLLESVRVAGLIVVLTAVTRLLMAFSLRPRSAVQRRLVVDILEQWADTSLAYFHLLDDKLWFLSADERSFVGYVLVGSTALALGEPIGPPAQRTETVRQFVEHCELNGWVPAFHQVTERGVGALNAAGMKTTKIGEEAIVSVQNWSIDRPEYKSLRSAIRRVERAGYEVVELPQPIDDATVAELGRVSQRWMADGRHRERTFTVGQFGAEYLRHTTVLVVRHRDSRRIAAFANIVPTFKGNDGNFDMMRRDPDAPNGVMEYLFVAMIRRFRDDGRSGMTLGLAPMANITGDSVRDRAMRLAYERGERLFSYQGLRRFKDKWNPQWVPLYLGYHVESDLPKVVVAIARAGELPDPRSVLGRLRDIVRRLPATLSLGALVLWFMGITAQDPDAHPGILKALGLAWRDLLHLQLWRLPTAELVETRPGLLLSNVALFFLVLPIAEWRLGTRRTVVTFFVCDWISTLITLVSLRVAAPFDHHAAALLRMRDGGPSAGAWALAATIAIMLPWRRPRLVLTAMVFGFLGVAVVFHHRLFDLQHLLAALAAVAIALLPGVIKRRRAPRQEQPVRHNTTIGVPI
ncbi:MAG: phosphatidylglycerol lysyltransferase domain-containing protein [Ilumatobacteraceae bacterium]